VRASDLARRIRASFRTHAALGLKPLAAPVMVFIPLGVVLGPQVLGILPETALGYLDVVVTIGLAALGVFIGLAFGRESRQARVLFAAATTEACITIAIVATAVVVLMTVWRVPLDLPYGVIAVALGICASASAAPAVEAEDDRSARIAARVADLDDVVPILLGGAILVMLKTSGMAGVLEGAILTIALGIAVGFAGWLLIERAEGPAERGVFVLGSIALIGGTAAQVGFSPLLTGMAAGWLWVVAPGRCDLMMAADLRKVQHPLVVLVLLAAGASLKMSIAGVWLFAPYLIFRLAGKLIGGWTASRIAAHVAPSDLGAYLIPPGVIGIAFALNLGQVLGDSAGALIFAVACGALASELLGVFLTPSGRSA
jgi:hypothetical protein